MTLSPSLSLRVLLTVLLLGCSSPDSGPGGDMTGPPPDRGMCPEGRFMCGTDCVDTSTSLQNCGRCGQACGATQICTGGACKDQGGDCRKDGCPSGYFCDLTGGTCKQGCGTNADCKTREVCDIGSRTCVCDSSSHRCGTACVSNFEPATCGDSCTPCPADPNGKSLCEAGQCRTQCNSGYYACTGVATCSQCCGDVHCRTAGTICQNNACVMGKRCTSTAECGTDQACQMGVCKTVLAGSACSAHADCPNGQVCESSKCAVVSCPAEKHGWSLSTCPSGSGCRRERCVNLIDAPCRTWSDCGTDYNCTAGKCSTKLMGAQDCGTNTLCTNYVGGYQCVNGHCLAVSGSSDCQADRECGFNYYCGTINKTGAVNRCTYICPSTGYPTCVSGGGYSYTCMSINCGLGTSRYTCCGNQHRSCTSDSNCSGGYKCVDKYCVSARSCATTSSCPFAESCDAGTCKFMAGRSCLIDTECGNGQVCMSGKCGPEYEAQAWR